VIVSKTTRFEGKCLSRANQLEALNDYTLRLCTRRGQGNTRD